MKKLVSLLLALALCAGLSVSALAAEFTDVPGTHTFHDAIADCAAKGITSGYADGSFRPAASVMNSWMNSDGHRANILSGDFTSIGIGYVKASSGYGHYWVQMFLG